MLTAVRIEGSGWIRLVRGTRDAEGTVGQPGKLAPGLLLQLDQVVTSSMGDSRCLWSAWDGPCKQPAPFAL